jgi:hypothetical protein
MTVCILKTFRHKLKSAGLRLHQELAGFPEVARCYTIGPGIVTPNRSPGDNCRRRYGKAVQLSPTPESGLDGSVISLIIDIWIL